MPRVDIVMPKLGESMAHGTLLKWLRNAGDPVTCGDPLFTVRTDMVDAEMPSPATGTVAEILVRQGEKVPVNSVLARLEAEVESVLPAEHLYESRQFAGDGGFSTAAPVAASSPSILSRQVVIPMAVTSLILGVTILHEYAGFGEGIPQGPLRFIIVFGVLCSLLVLSHLVMSNWTRSAPTVAYPILTLQTYVFMMVAMPRLAFPSYRALDFTTSLIVTVAAIPIGYFIGTMKARTSQRQRP
jgi:pyruvate/2-oxoglutarate dehydrogenase complex dihydrolipoamide acyltransferase (E2) component